jgi:hypothetical protein
MKNAVSLSYLALATAVALSACADATRDPITGPSLRRGGGGGGGGGDIVLTECNGTLPPGTYDNIIVPPGATCTINGSVIRGSVLALRDSRLFMSSDQVVDFIKGDGADIVHIVATTVGEQIFLHNGTLSGGGGFLNVLISNGTVVRNGNIHVQNMQADIIAIMNVTVERGSIELIDNVTETFLQTEFNVVGANVDVFRNSGAGGKFITNNTAGVAVRCFENTGAFFVGGPNFAPSRQGQCF